MINMYYESAVAHYPQYSVLQLITLIFDCNKVYDT